MAGTMITGAEKFNELGRRFKAAGTSGGGLRRELGKGLRAGAGPLVEDAQRRVTGLAVKGKRGGASARQARAAHALGKRKGASDKAKAKAHSRSGLRVTVARATSAKVTTGARSSSLRVRAAQAKMPPDQRKLPALLNRGKWRHPLYGNENRWYDQTAPPAWFDDAAEAKGPAAAEHAVELVDKYLGTIL